MPSPSSLSRKLPIILQNFTQLERKRLELFRSSILFFQYKSCDEYFLSKLDIFMFAQKSF